MEKTTFYASNREEWRSWLEQNHASQSEIWLIFYKKHTGQPTVSYDEAVEEALCFGWIDSILRRIDDEKHMQKFSPRKDSSNWSEINKRRVWKLHKEGKMTEAGLSKVTFPLDDSLEKEPEKKPQKELVIPDHIRKVLEADPAAWENFNLLAPSHKRQYVGWIMDAKKEETQLRRAGQAVELLRENKKLSEKLWDAKTDAKP